MKILEQHCINRTRDINKMELIGPTFLLRFIRENQYHETSPLFVLEGDLDLNFSLLLLR
jgi:hypothetical protein